MGFHRLLLAFCFMVISAASFAADREMREAVGSYLIWIEKLEKGDFQDYSDKFPKTKAGGVFRTVYRISRENIKVTFDLSVKLWDLTLDRITEGHFVHRPADALHQLERGTKLYEEALRKVRKTHEAHAKDLEPLSEDSEEIKELKLAYLGGLDDESQELSFLGWMRAELDLLKEATALHTFLDKNEGRIHVTKDKVETAEGHKQLEADYQSLRKKMRLAAERVKKLMQEMSTDSRESRKRMKDLVGTLDGA